MRALGNGGHSAPTVAPFHQICQVSASAAAFAVPLVACTRGFFVDLPLICNV